MLMDCSQLSSSWNQMLSVIFSHRWKKNSSFFISWNLISLVVQYLHGWYTIRIYVSLWKSFFKYFNDYNFTVIIGSGSGSVTTRQQAITCTKDEPSVLTPYCYQAMMILIHCGLVIPNMATVILLNWGTRPVTNQCWHIVNLKQASAKFQSCNTNNFNQENVIIWESWGWRKVCIINDHSYLTKTQMCFGPCGRSACNFTHVPSSL